MCASIERRILASVESAAMSYASDMPLPAIRTALDNAPDVATIDPSDARYRSELRRAADPKIAVAFAIVDDARLTRASLRAVAVSRALTWAVAVAKPREKLVVSARSRAITSVTTVTFGYFFLALASACSSSCARSFHTAIHSVISADEIGLCAGLP
jgi:hypothetical protein